MRQLIRHIQLLWHTKLSFRLAALYLLLLLLLVLLLPVLPLPYSPNELDLQRTFAPPLQWEHYTPSAPFHWLGTDAIGRDVLANVLYGARTAFVISLPVMLLSTVLGLLAGSAAGFYGDRNLKINRAGTVAVFLGMLAVAYYGLYLPLNFSSLGLPAGYYLSSTGTLLLLLALFWLLYLCTRRLQLFQATFTFPLDTLVVRVIEMLSSLPHLLLVLVLASFVPPSVMLLSLIFIFTFWTGQARLARAEMLQIKKLAYFEAAKSIGLPPWQLLLRHALPNMLGPILVAFTFGLAGLLALESTLSFLGIGVPSTLASWGRTIAGIRSNTSAWWLVAFPGAALALTVLALQVFSYHLLHALQGKKR